MSGIRYSAIIGSLGQTFDKFVTEGYKDPEAHATEFKDVLTNLGRMNVLHGADIYQVPTGALSDPEAVKEILAATGLEASTVLPLVFGERKWAKGSLSSSDSATRKEALALVRQSIDFTARLAGDPHVNLWLGQDGFDYPFQTNYSKQWSNLVTNLRALCDYNPKIKLNLEGKIREPRNRCLVDTAMTALLMCLEVDRPNLGVTIDFGHVFQAQQNAAQCVEVVAKHNKLFMIHANDNYNMWDDDMIVGSLRLTEYIEAFYSLRKVGYDGFVSVDIFPHREDAFESTRQSVLNMRKYDEMIDRIGFSRLADVIENGNPCEIVQVIRESVFK